MIIIIKKKKKTKLKHVIYNQVCVSRGCGGFSCQPAAVKSLSLLCSERLPAAATS